MTFIGVEFITSDLDEASIALVHRSWLTPRKKEVWWPPYKTGAQFKKALILEEKPKDETWTLYDEYQKANKKLKKCEEFSDVQSSTVEDKEQSKKRQPKRNSKYISTSEEEDDENDHSLHRPPKISTFAHALQDKQRSLTPVPVSMTSKGPPETDNTITRRLKDINSLNRITIPSPSLSVSTNISSRSESVNSTLINESYGGPYFRSFTEQIFTEIKKVREQVKEIYGILRHSNTQGGILSIPDDCPVEFPLKTREELQLLENYFSSRENKHAVSLFLSTLGGDTTTARTNKILKYVFTNELAKSFNFAGQKNKEAFEKLSLKTVVVRGVQIKSPSTTEKDIEDAIKTWLKHASDRLKESLKRKHRERL
ncbi:uncharacterized protein LOC105257319 [Camponotus floridanus]|uniref:uncharacterized protein LOC105257319 n=1 Tax=Camponotus floridanus TaxID=104421 RepID=UPI000DC6BD35|nr:uncharacterized protein LOC105257319 [Camponotus floridanus]